MLVHLVSKLRVHSWGKFRRQATEMTITQLGHTVQTDVIPWQTGQNFKWTDRWGHRVYIAPINRSEAVLSLKT